MLYASMFGAIVGTRFPGAVYVSQTLNFRKPVFVGDQITATLELRRSAGSGRLLDFDTRALNQVGDVVLDGEARVLLPRTVRLRPST
jgi:acyl dehydratase